MYTVKEASERLGISPHTIRYYTNQNLTPNLSRDKNGARLFSEEDIQYLQVAIYLRNCDMPIQKIRKYFSLAAQGDSTVKERYHMLLEQQEQLEKQLNQILESQKYITDKLSYYSSFIGQDPAEQPPV